MGSLPAQGAFLFLHSFLSLQGCVVADENREVVVLGLRPVLDGCGDGVGSLLGGEVAGVDEGPLEPGGAELGLGWIGRVAGVEVVCFQNAVGVEDEAVAGCEGKVTSRPLRLTKPAASK